MCPPCIAGHGAVWLTPLSPPVHSCCCPLVPHATGQESSGGSLTLGLKRLFQRNSLSFLQTGVDPGKVYLARKKYVKWQEKGRAQPSTKPPKFLLRQNKVTRFGCLCCWTKSPQISIRELLSMHDFLHCLPSHIYHHLHPFLPTHSPISPSSQNVCVQDSWKWLGAQKM